MARAENTQVVETLERFYREYYAGEIGELAQGYPTERKSLYVDWDDLYQFDPDLADDVRAQPAQLLDYAEEALRRYDLPVDVKLGQAHVRIHNLPEKTDIREIRHSHHGSLLTISGIVRKATDVRPKITTAAFECQRCGTLTRIPMPDGNFQEPHECQGCERQGPFRVNFDQSEFVDAQKLRIQESPEGLRGGETPQSIDVHIEDDITGRVTAGDHVTVVGILKLDQQGTDADQSAMFDVFMEGSAIEIDDEEFEEMDISDAEKQRIVELSNEDDLSEKMVGAIAPSIYGYEDQKLAMILQLFSGVTKHLPDESRIRGDMHMLLIGDPGTGKCVRGDTEIVLGDGRRRPIRDVVEENLEDPTPVDDGVYDTVEFDVPSLDDSGRMARNRATKVWKRDAPSELYRIVTRSGREIEVTPSHPLFVGAGGNVRARRADRLAEGEFVAKPGIVRTAAESSLDVPLRRSQSPNAVRFEPPERWTPSLARLLGYILAEGDATLTDDDSGEVTVTNEDEEILADVCEACENLDLPYRVRDRRQGTAASEVACTPSEFASFLENLEPALLERSANQYVPPQLFEASDDVAAEFLRAYLDSEGHVSTTERELSVASTSRELLADVRSLLLGFGVHATLEPGQEESHHLRISGSDFRQYCTDIGFLTLPDAETATAFDTVDQNPNGDVVPIDGDRLVAVRRALGISPCDVGIPRSTYRRYERGDRHPSRASLERVIETFEDRLDWLRSQRERVLDGGWDEVEILCAELGISHADLADGMGVSQTAISHYERSEVVPDGGHTADAVAVVLDRIDEALDVASSVGDLRRLLETEVRWDRIDTIERVEADDDWVYDLEVAGTHNYVAEGLVSHNSQLLQYIRHIAPRSVYTSGKGTSSAGLTAAAVRDDFAEGQQWSLEAGALVLADRGIAAVDELDKMRCITGDSLVTLGDGRVERIEQLAHEAAETGDIEQLSNGRTIRDVDLSAWTMTDDGSLTRRLVTAIHEYEAPGDLTRVRLATGESVTATPDHPFFVFEDGERIEREAAELEPGDRVPVPRSMPPAKSDGGVGATPDQRPRGDLPSSGEPAALEGLAGDRPEVRADSGPVRPDVELRQVESAGVEEIEAGQTATVYDLTVEETHNFVANGMVVHNSEDQSAMHEALEQQSISISKAGINATLKARCSLLGAANPTYGRFDQYEPIGEQIDLEPALISRFDLIFTVTDNPDEAKDAELAEHILRSNYAGELHTHRQQTTNSNHDAEEVAAVTDTVAPTIEPELLRKYIAFAKRTCFPTMSEEAKQVIQDFYVDLRAKGTAEDAPVPVTARKLEALVRLAEASARVRLSDTVAVEDAERATDIVEATLRDIGMDPETDQFDADVVETGTSKSQRDRIKNLKGLVADIEDEYDEGAPVGVVLERAEEVGMDTAKAEHEIEQLKQKGEVYEPRTDYLRTT
ncbi:MAG: LAGLIDADG family homing endonuclease [Haloarculaceae archaeon]